MRRAAKVDANQSEIVGALRDVGASVCLLHTVGKGVPDLLVGFRSDMWLIEVKSPSAKRKNDGKTDHQSKWHADWRGKPPVIVRNADDALRAIGLGCYRALRDQIVGEGAE